MSIPNTSSSSSSLRTIPIVSKTIRKSKKEEMDRLNKIRRRIFRSRDSDFESFDLDCFESDENW